MNVRVNVFTLSDAANVREGLLGILGAGANRIQRSNFPAPLMADIPVLLDFDEWPGESIELVVTLVNAAGVSLATVGGELQHPEQPAERALDTLYSSAVVVDARDLAVPEPGAYEMRLFVAGEQVADLRFFAFYAPGFGPPEEGSSDAE